MPPLFFCIRCLHSFSQQPHLHVFLKFFLDYSTTAVFHIQEIMLEIHKKYNLRFLQSLHLRNNGITM